MENASSRRVSVRISNYSWVWEKFARVSQDVLVLLLQSENIIWNNRPLHGPIDIIMKPLMRFDRKTNSIVERKRV